ncbi:hypothetical protein C922_00572 [Plasmodium inui San Antonio 1]|uniref:Uncharacterized protein n=1 Tax=Plasmodium inui San Antonio 1 TaxID=1237626 RepID=W7AIN3_9APIC|nr:hypothetical protein C922_00572 [Plasmodium inui San Antonio 1]EUD68884.1 hypothetical protein C922_00572 [Plasmodium inui San Antonio 1]
MENTAKKKPNEKKVKKQTNDVKERILSGRALLCFDEEIEFDKCGPVSADQVEDTTDKKKKKASDEKAKNTSLDSAKIGPKKKRLKKTKEGIKDETHDTSKDKEKIKEKKEKKKGTEIPNISNSKYNDGEDEINIYKNVDKDGPSNLNQDDVFNEVDTSTNSSASPRIQRNNIELKKKSSSKFIKLQSSNNGEVLNEENDEQLNKWIETLPSINSEIGSLLNNPLPCYSILNNIKRINKIKSIAYNENENENDEMLYTIEKSSIMFNSIKLTTREKYIIRFLCEGSSHTLSELVELLFYVLNNDELVRDKFPINTAPSSDKAGGNATFALNQADKNQNGEETNEPLDRGDENEKSRESHQNQCHLSMDNFSDEEYYSDDAEKGDYNIHISREDLLSSIPILLSRKSLGDNMKKMNVSKNENNEKECLWVWENDNYEIFPSYYKEIFKYFKEFRNNLSKIYKTLIKLRNSIVIINKNTWKEFNLIYKENIYGCQYMSWGKENNPFIYLSERNNPKNTLDNYDIKKLIKHSHGKATKKDVLVDQFKLKNEHLTKADTERKFKTYLVYKKCEDNRKKWMASEEGIKLFKNEQLLTKIYDIRKRKLNLITQKMEQVKRQKRVDKENLKKEEKIKRKEKSNQEKLANKDNMKKEAVKDSEKLEKKETITKKEAANILQKISSSSSLTGKKKIKK